MKYTCEITIEKPRDEVVKLMDDPENMPKWQRGLIGFEQIEGEPGAEGSKMKLRYKWGKGEMEMTETITKRNLPDEFHLVYEAKGVWNEVKNFFHQAGPNSTRWVGETEFRFQGLFMKIMAFLMPFMFKKQSMKYLQDFKAFAENGTDVRDLAKK